MTARTAPRTTARTTAPSTSTGGHDPALDEALDHIGELAERLWAVRRLHTPARRSLLGGPVRCSGCGQALPCPTLRAADPPPRRTGRSTAAVAAA